MHRRMAPLSATFVGTLLVAGGASAQNAPVANAPAASAPAAMCPVGCAPTHPARVLSPEERARRAEARRARLEAEQAREQELEQGRQDHAALERAQQDLDSARAERERLERNLAAERAENEDNQRQLSDANHARFEAEQRAALLARTPRATTARPRGGGPLAMRHGYHPLVSFSLDAGAGAYTEDFAFNNGIGRGVYAGPSWGARVAVEFFPFLAVEGRYFGMYNHGVTALTGDGAGLVTNATAPTLRLTAPIRYIQPYLFVGVGAYFTSVTGVGAQQATSLHGSTNVGMPLGVGVNVPITRHVAIGAEATYHRLFGESFSSNADIEGGDPVNLNGVLRWTM